MRLPAILRLLAPSLAGLLLGGCASFSADGGFGQVESLSRERGAAPARWHRSDAETQAARERAQALLSQPLDADSAVELALSNNPGLQARYAELGLAEADRVRAGRLANPRLSFARLRGGGVTEIDRSALFDLLGLLTLPLSATLGEERMVQAQWQAAADTVDLASRTRQAFYTAVASEALLAHQRRVLDAAEASDELARRMREAGHFNALAQMRQQMFLADAKARLARGRQQSLADREALVRLLGLQEAAALRLPSQLPPMPSQAMALQEVERTAIEQRLDVQAARLQTQATARALGLTRATRFVNVLEAGYANKSQTGEARQQGFEIELELPLFDFGATRNARAEALYLQSVQRTAQVAVDARSEVRESHAGYLAAFELARHYQQVVVPLSQRISNENLLRYNGMLIGVFDLLADAREQAASVAASIEAQRDLWLAQVRLQTALTGATPPAPASRAPDPGAASPGVTPAAH